MAAFAAGDRVTIPQAQPHKPVGRVIQSTARGVEVEWEVLLGEPYRSWWAAEELRSIP